MMRFWDDTIKGLPEFIHIIGGDAIHIDDASVAFSPIADERIRAAPAEINRKLHLARMVFVVSCLACPRAAKADLRKPRAAAHKDREGLRANFEKKLPTIASAGLIEAGAVISDDPGENVEAACGAFRISKTGKRRRKRKRLLLFRQRNAADLQHRALSEVYRVQHKTLDLLLSARAWTRHEARTHPEGARKPQIQTGGLYCQRRWVRRPRLHQLR